ncbi:MAG: hypothetical protein EOP88_17245 [Verrucomicrobiaceae bacterium]|nr:MAG: hypothetical protein EOP88_17245 [Verrucomicrobiaceae bacterium]
MKIICSFGSKKEDHLDLWNGCDERQRCGQFTAWPDRLRFLDDLTCLLQAHGSVSQAAWGIADFHFDPDPDLNLPCFISVVFNKWPAGLLLQIIELVEMYSNDLSHQFFLYIDRDAVLVSLLPGGNVVVFYDNLRVSEEQARVEISKGLTPE